MQQMTPQRWSYIRAYLRTVFGAEDKQLRTLMPRAIDHGLPAISITADVGQTLSLLASTTNAGRGPRLAVELGALAGYSGIWIARALAPQGRLITFEINPAHADFAQREFDASGLAPRIQIRRTPALEGLHALRAELGDASIDFAFIDAVKSEYPDYYALLKPMLAPGGLIVADNALASSSWCIDQPQGSNPDRDAVDRLNRTVAADPDVQSACLSVHHGLLLARRPLLPA